MTGRVLYRDGALADGRSSGLRRNVSILVEQHRIAWIRPSDGEEDAGAAVVVDCAGATFVPGMVDCHSHVTGPGGAQWIARFDDPPATLLAVAEHNGALGLAAGVRWMRDVGSPIGTDPSDGRTRALALAVRDRWAGRRDRPCLRAAGSWRPALGPGGAVARVADRLGVGWLAASRAPGRWRMRSVHRSATHPAGPCARRTSRRRSGHPSSVWHGIVRQAHNLEGCLAVTCAGRTR